MGGGQEKDSGNKMFILLLYEECSMGDEKWCKKWIGFFNQLSIFTIDIN